MQGFVQGLQDFYYPITYVQWSVQRTIKTGHHLSPSLTFHSPFFCCPVLYDLQLRRCVLQAFLDFDSTKRVLDAVVVVIAPHPRIESMWRDEVHIGGAKIPPSGEAPNATNVLLENCEAQTKMPKLPTANRQILSNVCKTGKYLIALRKNQQYGN